MTFKTLLSLVAGEFPKAGIRYMLIGGFAVNEYGFSRSTKDLDFLIADEDYPKAVAALAKYGFQEKRRSDSCARLVSSEPMFMPIDFLFVSSQTFQKMVVEAQATSVGGNAVLLPCVLHLIALKLHAIHNNPAGRMEKDMLDILALMREHNLDAKAQDFRDICLQYADKALYERICVLRGQKP